MNTQPAIKPFFSLPEALIAETRVTASALVVLILFGFAISTARPEAVNGLLKMFTDSAAEMGLYQTDGGALMATILANNLLSLLLVIAVGLIPFLHLPALSLGLNAMLIGGLAAYYRRSGLGLPAYLAGTLPHGVTELSALTLSCAAGLYLCRATTYASIGRLSARTVARTLSECLRVYTHWIVPLLVISAALEAFVTPLLLDLFLSA